MPVEIQGEQYYTNSEVSDQLKVSLRLCGGKKEGSPPACGIEPAKCSSLQRKWRQFAISLTVWSRSS